MATLIKPNDLSTPDLLALLLHPNETLRCHARVALERRGVRIN